MSLRPRLIILFLLIVTVFSGVIQSAPAHAQTTLIKKLIDGEWRNEASLAQPSGLTPTTSSISETNLNFRRWGRLVYTSYSDGHGNIYLKTPVKQGQLTKQLTYGKYENTYARLNDTADLIAFVSTRQGNRELYRMTVDGTDIVRLTASPADDIQPAWAPGSRSIIFASNRTGNWDLFRVNADGTNLTQLTTDGGADIMPSYSPDGKKIAWVRAGTDTGTLWLMNADGSNPHAITGPLRYLQHPSWSPDGTYLAIDYDHDGNGFNEAAMLRSDGTGLTYIPILYSFAQPGQMIDVGVSTWSPTGDWLVTTIYVYNVSGSTARLYNAYIGSVATDGSTSGAMIYESTYNVYPDLRSIDHTPPTSAIEQLPLWTRGATATIRWTNSEEPIEAWPSPLFDIQYRINGGAWVTWQHNIGATGSREIVYNGTPGTTVAFRIRARDDAGNVEPWHTTNGDTQTTFFDKLIEGTLTDNRGRQVGDALVNLSPAAIQPVISAPGSGVYTGYVLAKTHTAVPSSPGYAAPPATTLSADIDHVFSPYFLPNDNKVQNGGFENGISNWVPAGTMAPVVTTTVALTGGRSAQLGRPCFQSCLTPAELVPSGDTGFSPTMYGIAVDASGTAHTIWSKLDYSVWPTVYRLYHQTRSANGTWSQPAHIGDGTALGLLIDQQQTLHTVWLTDDFHLLYSRHPAGGNWSQPVTIATATSGYITLDHHGRLYLVYTCFSNSACTNDSYTGLKVRNTDGSWSPSYQLPNPEIKIVFAPDDSAYALWWDGRGGIIATIDQQGVVGPGAEFSSGYQVYEPQAIIDRKGTIHIVWNLNQDTYYVQIPPGGVPTLPMSLPDGGYPFTLLENGGTIYMLDPKTSGGVGSYIRAKTIDGPWTQPIKIASQAYGFLATTDASGRLHMLRSGPQQSNGANWYYQTILGAETGTSALKQSVAIPANMYKPTLSFEYSLAGVAPGSGSKLIATVNDGVQSTTVFTSTNGTGWSLASIDMQPWAGKTVDLAIELHQAAGAASASAFIDDVALGSWLTPVIHSITPENIAHPRTPTILTIHGENFINAPTVLLGSTLLTNVQRIDDQTIQATVPAAFKPGRYVLTVKNPGKQSAQVADIQVGYAVQVPVATR